MRASSPGFSLLLASWLAASPVLVSKGAAEEQLDGKALMKEFSSAFEGMEKGLLEGDAGKVLVHSNALNAASARRASLRPQRNEEMASEFNGHGAEIARISAEMAPLAARKDLALLRLALEEVRSVCVSCHLRFRAANGELGLFPARGNTLSGELKLLKWDGKERTDRSNVVVFLDGAKEAGDFPLPRRNPVISQKNRQFSPRVLPVLKGTTVDFPNDDTVFHNVFSLCEACPFDLDIYERGKSKSVTFSKAGLIKVYCNIHPDMIATILVLSNPYFALTDRGGFFAITGVPDGSYVLRTWNDLGAEARREVSLTGSSLHTVSLQVSEKRETIQHKNKFGQPYCRGYQ